MKKGRFIFERPKEDMNEVSLTIVPKGHTTTFFEHVVTYQLQKPKPPSIKIRRPNFSNEPVITISADTLRQNRYLESYEKLSFIHHVAKMIKDSFAVTFTHSIEDLQPNSTAPFEKFINTLKELDTI